MPAEMVCDYLGIRLNGISAAAQPMTLKIILTEDTVPDDPASFAIMLRNGVLVYKPPAEPPAADPAPDATYRLTRDGLNHLALAQATPEERRPAAI